MIEFTIVIPIYNQATTLETKFGRFIEWIDTLTGEHPRMSERLEVVFAEDGSTDGSLGIIKRLLPSFSCHSRVLHSNTRLGKGGGFRKGFEAARGKYVILYDTDMAVSPDQIPRLFNYLKKGHDIVVGSRKHEDTTLYNLPTFTRYVYGVLLGLLARFMFHFPFGETQCGFKGFNKETCESIIKSLEIDGWLFDLELLFRAYISGLDIIEIPVTYVYIKETQIHNVRDPVRILKDLLKMRVKLFSSYPLPFMSGKRKSIKQA